MLKLDEEIQTQQGRGTVREYLEAMNMTEKDFEGFPNEMLVDWSNSLVIKHIDESAKEKFEEIMKNIKKKKVQ